MFILVLLCYMNDETDTSLLEEAGSMFCRMYKTIAQLWFCFLKEVGRQERSVYSTFVTLSCETSAISIVLLKAFHQPFFETVSVYIPKHIFHLQNQRVSRVSLPKYVCLVF